MLWTLPLRISQHPLRSSRADCGNQVELGKPQARKIRTTYLIDFAHQMPAAWQVQALRLTAWRFVCEAPFCRRRILAYPVVTHTH